MWLRWLLSGCLAGCLPAGWLSAETVFQRFEPQRLEIRNHPLEIQNNTDHPYRFVLSVLGVHGAEFVPLLAVVLDPEDSTPRQWIAVWNLSNSSPGVIQRVKAALPFPWWSPRGGSGRAVEPIRRLPKPVLTARGRKSGARARFVWAAARTVSDFASFFSPGRFALETYRDHRNDLDERQFHQLYALLLLYEEAAALNPSPRNLGLRAIMDLKYTALINREALGIVASNRSEYWVVDNFESRMREKMGKAAAYLHSRATLHNLRFQEIHFGVDDRWPLYRTAVLSICKTDLPAQPRPWPKSNPFDLGYNPFEHPRIRARMDENPEEEIPLAYYVLISDFRLRPVIVLNFFNPGNPGRRQDTAVLRNVAENLLSVYGPPLPLQALRYIGSWSLSRKDVTYFSTRSVSSGIEPAKLFARMGWHFDEDTNRLLLRMLDRRTSNPLADSFARQAENAKARHEAITRNASERLRLFIRRIYEDGIRDRLDLGRRSISSEDIARYRQQRALDRALEVIRRFNRQPHLNGVTWSRLFQAWDRLSADDPHRGRPESRRFLQNLKRLYPRSVPEGYRSQVAGWIFPSGPAAQSSAFPAKTTP